MEFVERYRDVNIFKLDETGEYCTEHSGPTSSIDEMRRLVDIKVKNIAMETAIIVGRRLFHEGKTAPERDEEAEAYAQREGLDPDEAKEAFRTGYVRAYIAKHGFINNDSL